MIFNNIDKPEPHEIKFWLKELNYSINDASNALGISKRQIARLLSGATSAKRVHALAMQMLWLINENEKDLSKNVIHNKNTKSINIPIK